MNDSDLRYMLQLAEREAAVPPGLSEHVFAAMVTELEVDREQGRVAAPRRRSAVGSGRRWAFGWRPAFAIALAVATVAVTSVIVSIRDAPSALAALEDARLRFAEMPSYHARTAVRANDDAQDPDFETSWETEDWYRDVTGWRTTFTSSTSTSRYAVGDHEVMSPELYGVYDASTDVFMVRPASEVDGSTTSPSFFFDPSLQWWSDGSVGDMGKPSDEFFRKSCTATSGRRWAGRPATKLTCEAQPADLELWLDDATGMILRLAAFDIVREITSIELDPEFPSGIFDVVAPEGARKRWVGDATAPPEYAIALGSEVAARLQIVDGRTAGLDLAATTETDLWTVVIRCDRGCTASLLRIDARTGAVKATIAPPEGLSFTGVAITDGGEVWASFARWDDAGPTSPAYVQRLDADSGTLQGQLVETGTSSGGMQWIDGSLWTSSGRDREVVIGPAQAHYHSVARFDPATGAVSQLDIGADAIGTPLRVGSTVWVAATRIDDRNPREQVYEFVGLDPTSGAVQDRVAVPGWPSSAVTDGRHLYAVVADGSRSSLLAIDGASGSIVSTAPIGTEGSGFGGMVLAGGALWLTSVDTGGVLKIDPRRSDLTGSIATGLDPTDVASARGSVWVVNSGDGTLVRIDVE